ncbi:citrate lyase subunit beta [Streptomyces sp. CB02923]|uniref:HpcH/HpaI aldolase/citrate lyase family protein n=1 Tax=Streptomyces sp. CB02923 TaxID=1718985 RepID=UPI0009403A9E|nr:aldolase/citrate lyase family protein [Streptomyces sp. CB02923]OKI05279.1 citrate lyase subunit beta [Streptomyces sp. CB02923]
MTATGALPAAPAPIPPLTWLYVPGDRPAVVAKALVSGADAVVIDLEDAVADDRKPYALRATAELLAARRPVDPGPVPAPAIHVRVNALTGPRAATEIRALAALPALAGLRLPKVSGAADVRRAAAWAARAGPAPRNAVEVPPLHALLESALGVENAFAVATAHPALCGLSLGEADLRAELSVRDEDGLGWARGRTVIAARAAGLPPPPQSVFPDLRDTEALALSCARGRALGFLGRAALHPRQLPVIERAYLPTAEEVENAVETVQAATGRGGACALPDGRFVDPAVVAAARRVLALAARGTRCGEGR